MQASGSAKLAGAGPIRGAGFVSSDQPRRHSCLCLFYFLHFCLDLTPFPSRSFVDPHQALPRCLSRLAGISSTAWIIMLPLAEEGGDCVRSLARRPCLVRSIGGMSDLKESILAIGYLKNELDYFLLPPSPPWSILDIILAPGPGEVMHPCVSTYSRQEP